MKATLQAGLRGRLTTKVGAGNTITLGDNLAATVFSTPSMIQLMELAARDVIRPHLNAGQESVGVDVQIQHTAATPPRSEVTAEAVVTAVEKNVVTFDVVARDPWGEIGRGTHRRAVVDTSTFAQRLAQHKPVVAKPNNEGPSVQPATTTIDCQISGPILRLRLNRPEKRNAISTQMTGELEQLVDWLESDGTSIRVVIVSGAGETFCTGDDVGDLPDDLQAARDLSVRRGLLYRRITELGQVFIAGIDGHALGGGLVLAAACDVRIASHRARLGLPESLLGWPPNYGMGIVQSLIGRGRAIELAIGGQTIDARTAEQIGLVNRVVSVSNLDNATHKLAEQLSGVSPDAIAATKRLLAPGRAWSDDSAGDEFVRCLQTDQAKQSLNRFRK